MVPSTTRRSLLPLALALAGAAAQPAVAADGVIELNAARMAAGGATPGDTPGPPLTLSQPGSYVLTSDLFVTGTNETAVEITASFVALDLNGFSVRCLFLFTPCKDNGSGDGILVTSPDVTIRNGFVRDMARHGIRAVGTRVVVENVHAIENGGSGIALSSQSRIRGCVASGSDIGLSVDSGGIIADSSARNSTNIGIATQDGSLVTGSTATFNAFGISVNSSTVENSTAFGNGVGIQGIDDSLIRHNTVVDNTGIGIDGNGRSLVISNQIRGNGGFGIDLAASYGGNNLVGNNGGAEVQSDNPGVQIAPNRCGSDSVCP
jgi:hypothetical protein